MNTNLYSRLYKMFVHLGIEDLAYRFYRRFRNLFVRPGMEDFRFRFYKNSHSGIVSLIKAKWFREKVYLPRLEIPITTHCTLCCQHCANLMQYYTNPSHVPTEQVIENLFKVLSSVDGIACLRILGGEPLLHPQLYSILEYCTKAEKVEKIEIVTNGTLLLPCDVVRLLENNSNVTVQISDYGKNSLKKDELIEQMEKTHIGYAVNKLDWRASASLVYRNWSFAKAKRLFCNCDKCVSLLNGELHICPRSSHGTDLGVVPKCEKDYVQISQYDAFDSLRMEICRFINHPDYIEACQYCDGTPALSMELIPPGEQCSRAEAHKRFQKAIEENRSMQQ